MADKTFSADEHPGAPRVLIIGWANSPHTHNWMRQLSDQPMNVRLFCLPSSPPPDELACKSYVTVKEGWGAPSHLRHRVHPRGGSLRGVAALWEKAAAHGVVKLPHWLTLENALMRVLKEWEPDVVHSLGLNPATFMVQRTREKYGEGLIKQWVVTARGGPDLHLDMYQPTWLEHTQRAFEACRMFITDTEWGYQKAESLGLDPAKRCPVGIIPGTGGIEASELMAQGTTLPSQRMRRIVFPKAYTQNNAVAQPTFEGLARAWDRIKPAKIVMTWLDDWYLSCWAKEILPADALEHTDMHPRVDRSQVIHEMVHARVMLAPSLTDGVPNSLYEACAAGAFPIVSPLPTITPIASEPENVLFARNLEPEEIADAVVRAMTDDELVDAAFHNNHRLVKKWADKDRLRAPIAGLYRWLTGIDSEPPVFDREAGLDEAAPTRGEGVAV